MESSESASDQTIPTTDLRWALRERMKEIDTLTRVSHRMHGAGSLDEIVRAVIEIVQGGWQYPESTAVHIELDGVTAQTANYLDTLWHQDEEIVVRGEAIGRLTVAYVDAFPERAEGPFLAEERRLIRAIANEIEDAVQRVRQDTQIAHLLRHDEVTGLLTRKGLTVAIFKRVAEQPARQFGYFVIDLDRVWEVNRNFGLDAGNALFSAFADRLRSLGSELIGREGRRFVLLVDDLEEPALKSYLEERILPMLDEPIVLPDVPSPIPNTYVVAATHYPEHSDSPLIVSTLADAAISRAVRGHRRSVVADPEVDGPRQFALDSISEIRNGVAAGEFLLHYQPQVDRRGELAGVEALIRWDHNGRLVPPGEFIEVAEEFGLIANLLTPVVCFRAFNQAATWLAAGRRLRVAVNLSPSSLLSDRIIEVISYAMEHSGILPDQVELEVTEGAVMSDLPRAVATLAEFRERGFRVALDDFGTGYSSLALLRQLPLDVVKIDRTFVSSALVNSADAVIVQSIIDMARAVGAETVAEGVEDKATADWLWSLGVTLIQGYYFARPLHPDEIPDWHWEGAPTPT